MDYNIPTDYVLPAHPIHDPTIPREIISEPSADTYLVDWHSNEAGIIHREPEPINKGVLAAPFPHVVQVWDAKKGHQRREAEQIEQRFLAIAARVLALDHDSNSDDEYDTEDEDDSDDKTDSENEYDYDVESESDHELHFEDAYETEDESGTDNEGDSDDETDFDIDYDTEDEYETEDEYDSEEESVLRDEYDYDVGSESLSDESEGVHCDQSIRPGMGQHWVRG